MEKTFIAVILSYMPPNLVALCKVTVPTIYVYLQALGISDEYPRKQFR
jgi:hypothetical protein